MMEGLFNALVLFVAHLEACPWQKYLLAGLLALTLILWSVAFCLAQYAIYRTHQFMREFPPPPIIPPWEPDEEGAE